MLKLIDYILFRIVEFFQRENIGLVWFISFWVIGFITYYYEIGNGYETKLYWYDWVILLIFIVTYLRAKWIVKELEKYENKVR